MKIVCVGDAFITPDMMREGVAPFLRAEDSLEVLFWGQEDREAMRETARAHLVDTLALKRSLDRGRPLSVALDVFDTEPDIPGFLREYDNVTITSHRAGDTINSYKDAPAFAMDNYLGFLEGKPLRFRVN